MDCHEACADFEIPMCCCNFTFSCVLWFVPVLEAMIIRINQHFFFILPVHTFYKHPFSTHLFFAQPAKLQYNTQGMSLYFTVHATHRDMWTHPVQCLVNPVVKGCCCTDSDFTAYFCAVGGGACFLPIPADNYSMLPGQRHSL